MKILTFQKIFILFVFSVNQAFAAKFYSESTFQTTLVGDLDFSYSLSRNKKGSVEKFEKDEVSITVNREPTISTMWIEKRTRYGFLYLTYKNSGSSWENTRVSFRRYETHFKDMGEDCPKPPPEKNLIDLSSTSKNSEKERFAELFFEKNCSEKLNHQEFSSLVDATYTLLKADQNGIEAISDPKIVRCAKVQFQEGPFYVPFQSMRKQVSILLDNSQKPDDVSKKQSLPFPLSCENRQKNNQTCGTTTEGKKDKISVNIRCLKGTNEQIQQKAQEVIMHELAHTIRTPVKVEEKHITEFEKGNCFPKELLVTKPGISSVGLVDVDVSKNNKVAEENAKGTGPSKIAGDIVNPYESFADRATTPVKTQTTTVAANDTSSGATEVVGSGVTSGSSTGSVQQRSIASTSSFNSNSNSSYKVNTSIPTLQQQAQYQNVKSYVDSSVGVVAKKIAPVVNIVESKAFADSLPPTSFENGNRGETTASNASTAPTTAAATVRKAAASTGRSNEVAASSAAGSNSSVAIAKSANLGSSTSATASRQPAAVNKSGNRLASDTGLDNAYALKVRKKLLSDNAYRTELRNKGVQIEFADGYKFETPGHKVLYTEKNGVLVGGK